MTKLTLKTARAKVAALGFTLAHRDGEFVLRQKSTGSTYHTASDREEDLRDAVGTALEWWLKEQESQPEPVDPWDTPASDRDLDAGSLDDDHL